MQRRPTRLGDNDNAALSFASAHPPAREFGAGGVCQEAGAVVGDGVDFVEQAFVHGDVDALHLAGQRDGGGQPPRPSVWEEAERCAEGSDPLTAVLLPHHARLFALP
jgi:hypothetical protein